MTRLLAERGVRLLAGHRVIAVRPGRVEAVAGGDERVAVDCDLAIAVTHAGAPGWLGDSGLDLDDAGFVRVRETLQSSGDPLVFAAGDIASFDTRRLPKSGVYAVARGRCSPRTLPGSRPVAPSGPIGRSLSLSPSSRAATGTRSRPGAVSPSRGAGCGASRTGLTGAGCASTRSFPRWGASPIRSKRRRRLRAPRAEARRRATGRGGPGGIRGVGVSTVAAAELASAAAMRCGGCGSKVSSVVLHRVLGRLPSVTHPDVLIGFHGGDDAAVLRVPPDKLLVQSVDHFRTFIDDPWLFGRIATNHCLSDLFAMGAEPRTAQAMVTLPFAAPDKVEQDLFDLLSGVTEALAEAGAALVGGHTAEGPECALGLTVNGLCDTALLKGGAADGDRLLLTKPLGTGVIFAADMRAEASSEVVSAAIASMLDSNAAAARIFRNCGATSCTDVTGFGLLGHLVEMLRASGVDAELDLAALPRLPGTDALLERGLRSSLHAANAAFGTALDGFDPGDPRAALLFDPQTSGGLLAAVPAERGDECAEALAAARCGAVAQIGTIRRASPGGRVRVQAV